MIFQYSSHLYKNHVIMGLDLAENYFLTLLLSVIASDKYTYPNFTVKAEPEEFLKDVCVTYYYQMFGSTFHSQKYKAGWRD